MHIQEEKYLWDKMIADERSKARAFVTDLVIKRLAEMHGVPLWQGEMIWMNLMHRRIRDSFPTTFVDRSFIDYFKPKKEEHDSVT